MSSTLLFAHSSNELYGSDIVLLELARRLDPQRFRPLVVTPTDIAYDGLLSRALSAVGIEHRAIDMPVLRRRYLTPAGMPAFVRRLVTGPRRLQNTIRQENVQLIHSNTTAVWGGALAARRSSRPHVWHVHEIITQPVWVRRLIAGMVNRYSDHVVAISQAVANHLLQDQPKLASRLSVIANAVDSERFRPGIDGAMLRNEWRLPADTVLVGVVGRISAWKGQDFFLEALALARKQAPNLRGVIIGDVVSGEEWRRAQLSDRASNLGVDDAMIWAGYRSDAPQVMAALDILALPSTQPEPFGMVVLEAMSAGKAVVATAHGGPLETVVEGETGFLVDPHDPMSMARALVCLATRPELRAQLGAAGRDRVLRQYSFAQHVAAFETLYTRLLTEMQP